MNHEHRLGPMHPSVLMVEYGDYECPYCASLAPIIDDLLKEFSQDLAFVYRHFPLSNIHDHANLAAMAAEAADEQGQFWEMHKLLYENQSTLSTKRITSLARDLGLDLKTFNEELESNELWGIIESHVEGADQRGVDSTPSIFLNGERYEGSSSYWPLKEAIELEIERRKSSSYL